MHNLKPTRITGNFPIYGKESRHISSLTNHYFVQANNPDAYFRADVNAYLKGNASFDNDTLSGMFNYLTSALNYLYSQGIPEYANGVSYHKGAIVTFNGNIYISLTDDNDKHVTKTSHWNKVELSPNSSPFNEQKCEKETSIHPIGTILTVPATTQLNGFIDYTEGGTFDKNIYPELYKVLGQNRFSTTSESFTEDLPIGSLIHCLNTTANIPDGWIEFKSGFGVLNQYPELKEVLVNMANRLPFGQERTKWVEALRNNSIPLFNMDGFFLRTNSANIGMYKEDSVNMSGFSIMPYIVDESNTLSPIGYSRNTADNLLHSPVTANDVTPSDVMVNQHVLLAHKSSIYGVENVRTLNVSLGSENKETSPKALNARLLIKAKSRYSNAVPSTHKQIIRAF